MTTRIWLSAIGVLALSGCPEESSAPPPVTSAPTPAPAPAVAPTPEPTGEPVVEEVAEPTPLVTPTEVTQRGPDPMEPEQLDRWMGERIAEAHRGVRQFVRIPLVFRGPFGCDCPDNYVGVDPTMMDGGPWLTVINDSGQEFEEYDPMMGTVVVVDGYVGMGRTRYEGGDPADPAFMHPLHVTRIPEEQPAGRAMERVRLSLLGEATQCEVRVDDPESPLNVRPRPRGQGDPVGAIDHDTVLTTTEHRGGWTRIEAPFEGWVHTASTRVVCPAG